MSTGSSSNVVKRFQKTALTLGMVVGEPEALGKQGLVSGSQMTHKQAGERKFLIDGTIPEEGDEEHIGSESLRVKLFKEEPELSLHTQPSTRNLQAHSHTHLRPDISGRDSYVSELCVKIVLQDGSEAEIQIRDYDQDPVFEVMRFAIQYQISDLALIELIRRRVMREILRKKGMYKPVTHTAHHGAQKTNVFQTQPAQKPQNQLFGARRASDNLNMNMNNLISQSSKNFKKLTDSASKAALTEASNSGLHSSQVSGSNGNLMQKLQPQSSAGKAGVSNTQHTRTQVGTTVQTGLNILLNPQYSQLGPQKLSKPAQKAGLLHQSQNNRSLLQVSGSRERDFQPNVTTQSNGQTWTSRDNTRQIGVISGDQMSSQRARQAPSNSIDRSRQKQELLYHSSSREIRPETMTHNLYKQPYGSGMLQRQNSDTSPGPSTGGLPSGRQQIPEVSYTLSTAGQRSKVASGTGSSATPPPHSNTSTPTGQTQETRQKLSSVASLRAASTQEWLFGLLDSDGDGSIGANDFDIDKLSDMTSADVFDALQEVLEMVSQTDVRVDRNMWIEVMRSVAERGVWG